MDASLELYKSLLDLDPVERHERLLHLPRSERFRVASIVHRENLNWRLQEKLAGRDLIEMALSNPSEFYDSVLLQNALLGRTSFSPDETKMIQRVVGAQYNGEGLFDKIANFDQKYYVTMPIDVCSLQDIYESRLREEELQTPAARARENIRRDVIKAARRNAKWVLSELDRLSDGEKAQPLEDFGETAQQPWGFVYYKAKEVEEPYDGRWDSLLDMVNHSPMPSLARDVREATYFSIHCQGKRNDLAALHTEVWATVPPEGDLAEDDGFRHPADISKHIGVPSRPGVLQNTFIVIPIELVSESEYEELHPNWVWAYDADWDSSTEETVSSSGEKYQG
ncbi:hypothetical protein F25303_775 [Fusarium sp. NRRL 25303]|nr:hypothetical protein F25303_775 [Fusarium sp. NRRL 25303]